MIKSYASHLGHLLKQNPINNLSKQLAEVMNGCYLESLIPVLYIQDDGQPIRDKSSCEEKLSLEIQTFLRPEIT